MLSSNESASDPRHVVVNHRPTDFVLTLAQWCELNAFSVATGRRIIARGEGPRVLQLSARRIGIRQSDNLAWQESRLRNGTAAA